MSKNFSPPPHKSFSVKVKTGLTAIFIALSIAAGLEVNSVFILPQDWGGQLSPLGILAIVGNVVLLACGILVVGFSLWSPDKMGALSWRLSRLHWGRWLVIAGLVLFTVWFYLYSPWQSVFPGPWTHFLFLLSLSHLLGMLAWTHQRILPDRQEGLLAIYLFLYINVTLELRAMTPLPAIYRAFTFIGIFTTLALLVIPNRKEVTKQVASWFIALRDRLGRSRWPLILLLALAPIFFLYLVGGKSYTIHPYTRFTVSLLAALGIVILTGQRSKHLFSLKGLVVGAGLQLFFTAIATRLILVTNYPFTLYWSEGNRFYDYSLIFAQHLYDYPGKIESNYFSPGRYALWGLLFLWPGLPIWVHRLWNALLTTIPPLIVGWLTIRLIKDRLIGLMLALGLALFLLQGPVQPPLLIVAILVVAFAFTPNLTVRGISLGIASLYAGLSRFTWVVGPGVWGALIDLMLYYPRRTGSFIRRILPTTILALLGILPGTLASLQASVVETKSLAFRQPLLWYRLLPNPTYPPGILLGITLATGPLVVILIWLMVSRRWKLDGLQSLASVSASLVLLAAGIVISAKIGGGGDLHNFDMYIITLSLLAGMAATAMLIQSPPQLADWPRWVQITLLLLVFIVAQRAFATNDFVEIPSDKVVQKSLETVQNLVVKAERSGEILFMDQRQLLTFGYIQGVPLVPEYEKKFMMDQAMSGNPFYFQTYYQDLAKKRFSLIITEPIKADHKGELESLFSEENNDWVKWVSKPTLCFYRPLVTMTRVRLQLLVPNQDTSTCINYVE